MSYVCVWADIVIKKNEYNSFTYCFLRRCFSAERLSSDRHQEQRLTSDGIGEQLRVRARGIVFSLDTRDFSMILQSSSMFSCGVFLWGRRIVVVIHYCLINFMHVVELDNQTRDEKIDMKSSYQPLEVMLKTIRSVVSKTASPSLCHRRPDTSQASQRVSASVSVRLCWTTPFYHFTSCSSRCKKSLKSRIMENRVLRLVKSSQTW